MTRNLTPGGTRINQRGPRGLLGRFGVMKAQNRDSDGLVQRPTSTLLCRAHRGSVRGCLMATYMSIPRYNFAISTVRALADFFGARHNQLAPLARAVFFIPAGRAGRPWPIRFSSGPFPENILLRRHSLEMVISEGIWIVNVEPFSGSLSTATFPPSSSVNALAMYNPSPTPSKGRVSELSIW